MICARRQEHDSALANSNFVNHLLLNNNEMVSSAAVPPVPFNASSKLPEQMFVGEQRGI